MRRVLWIFAASVAVAGTVAAQPIITTVAGSGPTGAGRGSFCGDGGPATSACLNHPVGAAMDAAGNLYVADSENQRIRKIDASGTITTVAGNGTRGFCGDGGPATSACLNYALDVAVDGAGNLFIVERVNNRVRKVDASGNITTVAGNGTQGFCGDGGPATSACLNWPSGLAADAAGNLFIADLFNQRVRKVDTAGRITTVAGKGTTGFCGDGGPATSACLYNLHDVAVDGAGNLFIADSNNNRVRRVDGSGTITTVAGSGARGHCGDGGPATSACLDWVPGVAVDAAGRVFASEGVNHRVRMVDAGGMITTVAGSGPIGESAGSFCGDGGPATSACLNRPQGMAVDAAGRLFITDVWNQRIRMVESPLHLSKPLISGCMKTTGKVTLAAPAPAGGLTVALSSDNPNAVVPPSIVIKAGATKKTFSILTSAVAARETAVIEASMPGHVLSATLTLKPMGPKSVTLTPNPVVGGATVAGMVTLECPAGPGDIEVALTSSKAYIAEPTSDTILIPVGAQNFPFDVRTTPVFAPVDVTIKATANDVTKSKKLSMNPVP